MIGVGGWGGRNEKSGPWLYVKDGKLFRDTSAGNGGAHGPQREFVVKTQDADHPITKGLPAEWMHAKDELYTNLRGPAEGVTVLATAYAAHPDRFVRHHPVPPPLPTAVWINPPKLLGPAEDDRAVNAGPLVSQTR